MSEPKQPLCLTGKAVKFIDNKHRIYIPAYLFNQLTDKTFHMTRGQDKNLYAYPTEIFLEKAARLNKYYGSAGQRDREKRLYFMETMADAQPVQCVRRGRG